MSMNLYMMFRSDVECVDELPKTVGYYDYRDIIPYCERTDTCGPCLVCDIGDFNNLMRFESEYKFPEHRMYADAKFMIKVFPRGEVKKAKEWVISQLEHLEPFNGYDELGRNKFDYVLATDKAKQFPSTAYALNGEEIKFRRQYDINRLILEDGYTPIYPEMSAVDRVYHLVRRLTDMK